MHGKYEYQISVKFTLLSINQNMTGGFGNNYRAQQHFKILYFGDAIFYYEII